MSKMNHVLRNSYGHPVTSDLAKFIRDRVETEPNTGCELWTGAMNRYRRPTHSPNGRRGPKLYVHRLNWELHNGPIPAGISVLHKCDTPECVNVDHLFLGTQRDNIRDMDAKGRRVNRCGEDHPRRKLRWEDVEFIRTARASARAEWPNSRLALRFGVSTTTIVNIAYGRIWKAQEQSIPERG